MVHQIMQRYDERFIQTILCFKRRFPFIPTRYVNLMMATTQINFREDWITMKTIQYIIQPQNRKAVYDGNSIYCPIVNTRTP